jgi:ADP-heptose:LPS heptosyltransferase
MDTSKLSPELTESVNDEVKVIVIKLPFDLLERILTFPFIHLIRSKYPVAHLHFITPKRQIEVLNLLPFEAFYHEFDEGEISTVFDVHRFTATAKIFNVDIFISLTNSFIDGCLGVGLRAKKRVGFSDSWKTLLFNYKTKRPVNHHLCEDFFALYASLASDETDNRLRVMSRDLRPVIDGWDSLPYIAVDIGATRDSRISEDLFDFLNFFENQRIILFASEDQERISLLIPPFISRLSKKNIYSYYVYPSWIDLGRMLAFSRGVVTNNGAMACFAAYVGAKTLALYEREDPQRSGPLYFLADFLTLCVSDPTIAARAPVNNQGLQGPLRFDMAEVYAKAYVFFDLAVPR